MVRARKVLKIVAVVAGSLIALVLVGYLVLAHILFNHLRDELPAKKSTSVTKVATKFLEPKAEVTAKPKAIPRTAYAKAAPFPARAQSKPNTHPKKSLPPMKTSASG